MAGVIFGVKGIIILLYSTSATPHVFTNEIVIMWSLLLGSLVYFVAVIVLLTLNVKKYHLAENLNAYTVFVFSMLVYSLVTMVECTEDGIVICRYLFPVSSNKIVENSINIGLMLLFFLVTVSYAVSTRWNRTSFWRAFAWGGLFFAVLCNTLLLLVAYLGAVATCPRDQLLTDFVGLGDAVTFAITCAISGPVYVAPFVLAVWQGAEGGALTWDSMANGATSMDWIAKGLILAACAVLAIFTVVSFGVGYMTIGNGLMLLVLLALALAAPVWYWLLGNEGGDGESSRGSLFSRRGKNTASTRSEWVGLQHTRGPMHKHV